MCGIAGIISVNSAEISSDRLKKMTDIISYRGPDGEGHWSNSTSNVSLGHRRLSIIDLSHEADQPMHYLDRYSIVFNGEIYNYIELKKTLSQQGYIFKTSSDTEVLMALYDRHKEDCLQLLDGMFSFAIYDQIENTIFAARDRFGEKPFFYSYISGKYFLFGSEIKCLWAGGIKKEVNHRMLYNYLQFNYLENPNDLSETFYDNCLRLPHSHYLILSVADCKITQLKSYYKLDQNFVDFNITGVEVEQRFRDLFYTSVKRRLRSDVPVGSSLSGGLDSSLVVCVIDELTKGTNQIQKTFSARFPGFARDEGYFMQLVADQTNIEPIFVYPSEEGLIENFNTIFYHQEEPFGSSSIYAQFCVMQAAKQNDITVLLDGQGADEILGGYHSYFNNFFNDLRLNYPKKYKEEYSAYEKLQSENSVNPFIKKDISFFIRSRLPHLISPLRNTMSAINQKSSPFFNTAFFNQYKNKGYQYTNNFGSLNEALNHSLMHGPIQQLLRFADRNSMANSIEVRLPFLSHELVEFVFSLPPYYKIHNGWTKWVMRNAFKDLLPSPITWRKDKIGYEPPQKRWMESPIIKEEIMSSKKRLFDTGIISKQEYEKDIPGASISTIKNKTWPLWVAGKMV